MLITNVSQSLISRNKVYLYQMYTKVWFPGIRYAYNKCMRTFDFIEYGKLKTNVWFPRIRYAYNKCIPKFWFPRIRYAYNKCIPKFDFQE